MSISREMDSFKFKKQQRIISNIHDDLNSNYGGSYLNIPKKTKHNLPVNFVDTVETSRE